MARRYFFYVVIAMVVAAAILSILAIQRYRNFYGGRFDMGNMVQAVYNTAHGHFLQITTTNGRQASRLGSHVDPILAVFAIPWLVWPSPIMLLVAQAVIVALAAWPAYRLGLRILGDARAAFLLSVALLLYPPLQYAVLNEFHPVTLAIPFLLFAFVFIDEGHWWRAAPFLVLAVLCKEEIPTVDGRHGSLLRAAQAQLAAAHTDGRRRRVLRDRRQGRAAPLQPRRQPVSQPLRRPGVERQRHRRELRPQARGDPGAPVRLVEPALLFAAAVAPRVQLAAEPPDHPDRRAGVRAERAGQQRLSALV